jgi:multisubunit Na+/H+ antiporter MnhG subunit
MQYSNRRKGGFVPKVLNWISSLFSTNDGVSTMRLMALLSLLSGTAIAFWGIHKGVNLNDLAFLVGVFVTSAFGGKAMQKSFEIKNDKK